MSYKLILYTDGSAILQGNELAGTGFGIHGLFVELDKKTKQIKNKYVTTEIGYMLKTTYKATKNIKEAEFLNGLDIYGSNPKSTTNNQAEADAFITALELLPYLKDELNIDFQDVLLLSDSNYVLGYAKKSLENNLDLENVTVNEDYIEKLFKLIKERQKDFNITINKVKAHADNIGNNRADMLALIGRYLGYNIDNNSKNFKINIEGKDFWKDPDVDNDYFYYKQIFNFFPDEKNSNGTYFGLNYKEESDIGKKISYVSYTITKTKDRHKIIDSIIDIFRNKLGSLHVPYVIRLRELLNKQVVKDLLRFQDHFLNIERKHYLKISTLDKTEVGREVYPPGLSMIVMNNFINLDEEFTKILNNDIPENIEIIDITDMIYTKDKKDKVVIKSDIKNDKYNLVYKYGKTKIKLQLKYDLPPRNNLKRLEKLEPQVLLIIKKKGGIIEYDTIVKLNNGDAIYTSNFYANKLINKNI